MNETTLNTKVIFLKTCHMCFKLHFSWSQTSSCVIDPCI